MAIAHHRKKQPEQVRQQLLSVAARLAYDQGLGNVTLDAVSQKAGVSKGGLLHHFPSKMALLNGLFDDMIDKFDAAMAQMMRSDPVPQGRFTRAYISTVFAFDDGDPVDGAGDAQAWHVLTIALLAEPPLRDRWRQWVADRTDEFVGTDSSPDCQLARFAADGIWLADLLQSHDLPPDVRSVMLARLNALSLQ
ncbi:TetR/AcrR family transcriptional regulator [Pararhizobium antarcticum]|uniref:TetR family transcriptional regulator n=1 Tax=Pararhizobium antarcticum TaxID=1798805 RepID=A0A657LTP4_9HYPH|nr:TetR/AcrR family transcriptional regulator [Pararhizobium antarcticum]OJF94355.1 TetR family transcriptional regulator [Rhizobium sp. 58]OJF96924.1 TetR family transcriptional regulator [Pararhizobium antarcticum]